MTQHAHFSRKIFCRFAAIFLTLLSASASAKITVTGIDNGERKKIIAHLEASELLCHATRQKRVVEKKIEQDLIQVLQALGYFNSQWEIELEPDKKCWDLRILLQPGPPLTIRTLDVRLLGAAAEDDHFNDVLSASGMVESGRFYSDRYEKLKQTLQARALRYGYFDANFLTQEVIVFPAENEVAVSLVWDSGNRYLLGEVLIEQSVLEEDLFQQLLTLESGHPYDLALLQRDQARLSESRYFSSVDIRPLVDQLSGDVVPVAVNATAGPKESYQYGLGYSTDSGPRLRADYARHRINDRGHKGNVQALFSRVLTTVNLDYSIPWRDPRTDNLRFDVGYVDEETDSYDSERWQISVAENRKLDSGLNQTLSLSYSAENSQIALEKDHSAHLIPAVEWSKITADNPIYPTSGARFSLKLLGSSDALLSESSFFQLNAAAKWVRSLPAQFRLLARTEVGITVVDTIDDLPASLRFFTGGDNSIRGYEYQSLGPEEEGEVIGGKHLAVASLELERPLYGKWSLAAFVDGGNAWSHGELNEVIGIGAGLRWRSPIGPLRLDLGVPLEDDTGSDFQIHFTLGPEF